MGERTKKVQESLAAALDAAAMHIRSWGSKKRSEAPTLLPLTPKYDPDKHGVYFDVIETALSDPRREVRNIALTGSYGVGKSSILSEVARRHGKDVIAVSLSTLGFPDDEPLPAGDAAKAASTKTNRIQKEIVKQLLYSQDPLKTPGSRYRRTTRFRFWRTLWLAALLSLPIALVFFLTGWTTSIDSLIPGADDAPWVGHAVVFAGSALLLLGLLAVFHNRIQIEKLGAGAATISLSAKSATYFDEYLDEIVYFFEVVKRDIVVFEDIDRFDDAHIFETLRSLNSILNGADQLRGRKIRFIYAIKDSIFDELGTRAAKEELAGDEQPSVEPQPAAKQEPQDAAEAEIARANRTKFFDLVVPVVPFVTHRSARDLLVQTLGADLQHGVSDELIDLVAKYVADMRLIKNIRNEYAIFKRQIIDAGSLELSEDNLFAMVLYKSTHLSDFELIKLGKSNLDALYRDGRTLVNENIRSLNATIRTARQRRPAASIAPAEAKQLGDLLAAHIARTFRHLGLTPQNGQQTMAGEEISDADLRTPEFWENFAATDGTVEIRHYRSQIGRYETVSFSRNDVAEALGRPIESATWISAERERIDKLVAKAAADRDFLSHADMGELMKRGDFSLEVDEERLSFAELAAKHLTSEMAVRLVEAGYIDRNFTLYTSTFYTDRVSANATNYILKNVDPNTIDLHFVLDHSEVESVLRERGRGVLGEKAAYNVSVVDYLVTSDPKGLETLVTRLIRAGDEELELLHAYLDSGAHGSELITALAPRWDAVFTFLISEAGLEDATLLALVDTAVRASSAEINYEAGEPVGRFVLESYRDLDVFTSGRTTEPEAERAAEFVADATVQIPSLDGLAPTVRAALVRSGGYIVTRANLLLALEDQAHSLALDAIKTSSDDVYKRVLDDLEGYLAALGEGQVTVADPASFVSTLEDVLKTNAAQLSAVIERSSTDCVVADLAAISTDAWEPLAAHDRFPLSFPNVNAYVDEFGVDEELARRLTAADAIETEDGADEAEKTALAVVLLGAATALPPAKLRAELAGSLRLKDYLEASTIPSPSGEYVGWLIVEEIIKDDAAAFAVIPSADVDGLAFAISKSDSFADFMTPTEITPSVVGSIIGHNLVPQPIKDQIVARFTEFTAGTSRAGLVSIARYAVGRGLRLTFDETARLAREGVDSALVIALLQHHLASIGAAELASVLVSFGGEYKKLSAANGKHPHIPNTPADRALVERLEELGIVSTHTEGYGEIRAHMRQP